jgi:gliding motility-associated-like protein
MDSAILVANAPATGQGIWTLQSGSAYITNMNIAASPVKAMGSGENIFRWTITYMGCSSSDEMAINNDFMAANAGIDKILCANETVLEANDPGYGTGTWTLIGGTGSDISNSHMPNATIQNLAYGTNTFRWTVTKSTCSSFDEVSIINNLPTPSFAGEDMYLCDNKTSLMAGSVMQGQGTWTVLSGAGSFGDIHSSNTAVTGLETGSNIFRWTTQKAGCVSADEVVINNNQPVNIYAGLDQVLCDDSTALYAGMPVNGSGSWSVISGSSTFADDRLFNTTVTHLGNGQNTLKWLVANTGCSESDTVVITNNLPTRAIAGSDFAVCNSMGSLNANSPLFGTGEWSLINGAGVIGNTLSSQTAITDLSLGNNTLRWTITNRNCVSIDEMIIVNNSPTVAMAGPDFETCGPSAVLFANSPMVGSGHWQVISGMADIADSLGYNTTVDKMSFGPNTLRWTTENGTCLTFDDIVITNNLAFVNAGADKSVYEDNTVLSGNNPELGTGKWVLVAGSGTTGTPASYTTAVNALAPGLNTFEWTIKNGSCTAHDAVTINFKIMPKVSFIPDITKGCPSLTVSFVNATQYGTTYLWDLGDGNTSPDVNISHTYNVAGNYHVKLTAFGPDNRNVTRDTVIIVHRPPVADFQFAPDTAFINRPLRCYNYSFGATSYNWDFGDNTHSDEASPVHKFETGGEFSITLIAASENQCTDTVTYTVFVSEDGKLIFPNAFTPNLEGPGDGSYADNDRSNDVFHPYAEGIAEYALEIYSRWGVLLFESKDVNAGWDGYYKGKLMSKDVYVWRARGKFISGSEFMKTGSVLLVK